MIHINGKTVNLGYFNLFEDAVHCREAAEEKYYGEYRPDTERSTKRLPIPSGASSILNVLHSNGFDAYVVGGCVRDSLLGIEPKDWDICTSATPEQILECFSDRRIIKTGLKHGTVTVVMGDNQYEVTTFRVDGKYSDNRHPDSVEFVKDIRWDLARRDFTINAIAYNSDGFVDPFGGIYDLWHQELTCVGNPDDRFAEDALRILRALRFASVYGFQINENTAQSIHRNKDRLKTIAAERIQSELCKLLCGRGVLDVLLDYSDVIAVIIPGMEPCIGFDQNNKYHEYTVYDHIAHAVANSNTSDVVVRMALLLHDIGKPQCYSCDKNGGHFYYHSLQSCNIALRVLGKLRFDNKSAHEITDLVFYHDAVIEPTPKCVRKWLTRLGEKQFMRLLEIRMADILAHKKETQDENMQKCRCVGEIANRIIMEDQCFKLKDLAIDGYDVMDVCGAEGAEIGRILNEVLDTVIEGTLENTKENIIKYLEEHYDKRRKI